MTPNDTARPQPTSPGFIALLVALTLVSSLATAGALYLWSRSQTGSGGPPVPDDQQPVETNGRPSGMGDEIRMGLLPEETGPHRPVPELLQEYRKDLLKPRFYRGSSWRYRPPTRAEQRAVMEFWFHQPQATPEDEPVKWNLASVSKLRDAEDMLGQHRDFQVRIRTADKAGVRAIREYLFNMRADGEVYSVAELP